MRCPIASLPTRSKHFAQLLFGLFRLSTREVEPIIQGSGTHPGGKIVSDCVVQAVRRFNMCNVITYGANGGLNR
jgi:hypothetical protein